MTKYQINVNLDAKCKRCGKGGATQGGYCIGCLAKMVKEGKFDHIIKPLADKTKKDISNG